MAVLDTQLHLPTDTGKGEQLGYTPPIPDLWVEQVAAAFDETYGDVDDAPAIVPTVTNRTYRDTDELYLAALRETDVAAPTRAVELDDDMYSANILGRYDPSYFGDVGDRDAFIDAIMEHTADYADDTAVLLSHPFSKDGGLFRDMAPDDDRYQQMVDLADDHAVYTDQHGNAWTAQFAEFPWSVLNRLDNDRFGLQYWDITADTDGTVPDVGCSDAKDAELAGYGASFNPDYGTLDDFDDVTAFLDHGSTLSFTHAVPTEKMLRKIGSGLRD